MCLKANSYYYSRLSLISLPHLISTIFLAFSPQTWESSSTTHSITPHVHSFSKPHWCYFYKYTQSSTTSHHLYYYLSRPSYIIIYLGQDSNFQMNLFSSLPLHIHTEAKGRTFKTHVIFCFHHSKLFHFIKRRIQKVYHFLQGAMWLNFLLPV